ncbi:MAG: hypothetical protein V4579_12740 [Pseudomonadota bacterium]
MLGTRCWGLAVVLPLIANTMNLGADLGAMAAALNLLVPVAWEIPVFSYVEDWNGGTAKGSGHPASPRPLGQSLKATLKLTQTNGYPGAQRASDVYRSSG